MLTMTAVLTDAIKLLPQQERKHLNMPIKGECVLHL